MGALVVVSGEWSNVYSIVVGCFCSGVVVGVCRTSASVKVSGEDYC